MSEADKMFFKLDFEKKETFKKIIYYLKLPIWQPSIIFNQKNRTIKCDFDFGMQELQAINLKCEELGWIEC